MAEDNRVNLPQDEVRQEQDLTAKAQKLYDGFTIAAGGVSGLGQGAALVELATGHPGTGLAYLGASFVLALGLTAAGHMTVQKSYPEAGAQRRSAAFFVGAAPGILLGLCLTAGFQSNPEPESANTMSSAPVSAFNQSEDAPMRNVITPAHT